MKLYQKISFILLFFCFTINVHAQTIMVETHLEAPLSELNTDLRRAVESVERGFMDLLFDQEFVIFSDYVVTQLHELADQSVFFDHGGADFLVRIRCNEKSFEWSVFHMDEVHFVGEGEVSQEDFLEIVSPQERWEAIGVQGAQEILDSLR
ncbi:MAG: hypothetical protein MI717_12290 [Spirochaetales bacterium]|nr:hypothetical protein [Spirochaetales bacterium]